MLDTTYRVSEAQSQMYQPVQAAAPAGPKVGDLFRFGMGTSCAFFLAALMICAAGGVALREAFQIALRWAGISLGVVWPVMLLLFAGGGIGQMLDHVMLARLRAREIERDRRIRMKEIAAHKQVRLAEITMQRQVSLAATRVDHERREVAQVALAAANATPRALLLRSPAEEKLIDSVVAAYGVVDPSTGYLRNDKANPFGKRALGTEYQEIVSWLQDPGSRHNVKGSPAVATYDSDRRSWRLNLDRYPTPERALQALTGHR